MEKRLVTEAVHAVLAEEHRVVGSNFTHSKCVERHLIDSTAVTEGS
jgi:hypothetical protein